ncbi:hypothetical protein [Levilactobacillus tujiorum]|uniref:Uncharacterized protein n=1 Tax=Levilactobacillus tujiorum TaxID=2912243 RepID=A0ABX1L6J9_9LACO|nr:hypothetical protein [Levilactobacillus tujiorum]MCH5464642.1 hypothetical protein [Levilactobacillus tujiorum]NLR11676.1 hypothetical protein [Lactobacillus sp. HBUAS51387]NLR29597.1 hypothetical protein [Levilactobacillus tujiorum]NLR32360.1 hypothetical protein [Levilactobacillus tujiorum]
MTEQSEWLRQQIDQLAGQQEKFTERAFWLALKKVTAEQERRSDQLSGEVDGRTWRPDHW